MEGEFGDGALHHLLVDRYHDAQLKCPRGLEREHALPHLLQVLPGKYPRRQQRKGLAVGDTLHGLRDFVIIIGPNVVEFIVHDKRVLVPE